MLKLKLLILSLILFIGGAFAQIGTGWSKILKKQNFRDSTYVSKGIKFPDGTIGTTGFQSGDTVSLSSVAVMLVDSTSGYVTPYQLQDSLEHHVSVNAVPRDSLYIDAAGYLHAIANGYNYRYAPHDSTELDSQLLTDLTAYWSLEETTGSAVDSSENGWNGTLSGTISQGTGGKLGKCYNFEADSSGYVNFGSTLGGSFGTADLSVSCWVNVESQVGNKGIIGTWNGENCWYLYTSSGTITATLNWGSSNFTTTSNSAVSTGAWHHIVFTADRDGYTHLYIDGTAQSSSVDISAGSGSNLHTTNELNIGVWGDRYTAVAFDGKIDEVGIWSRVLTADEVSDLYNTGLGLAYPF